MDLDVLVWRLHALKCPKDLESFELYSKFFQVMVMQFRIHPFCVLTKTVKHPSTPLAYAGVCDVSAPFDLELSHCRGHVWDLVGRKFPISRTVAEAILLWILHHYHLCSAYFKKKYRRCPLGPCRSSSSLNSSQVLGGWPSLQQHVATRLFDSIS